MRLKVQTFINNEFRISVQSDNPKPKKVSDTASIKRNTKRAIASQKVQHLDRALSKLLSESPETIKEKIYDSTQLGFLAGSTEHTVSYNVISVLPKTYKCLTELPDGRFVVKNVSTDELLKERQRNLDIISESQPTRKKKHSFGEKQRPKAFTKTARHRLLEAGAAIDLLGLKKSSSLLTLTLPGGTPEAKQALANWSGWIVDRQTQYLRRHPVLKNCYWFFVWEWQDRGALHQHWCVSAPTYELAQEASFKLKDAWYQCLKEIGIRENIDMFMKEGRRRTWKSKPHKWIWNEQQVKKSVGSYFAKYASKEYAFTGKKGDVGNRKCYFPSRWFGSSSNIKKLCKSYRVEFSLHNITKQEASYCKNLLIAELERYNITQRFKYDFEVMPDNVKKVITYNKEVDKKTGELNKIYELKASEANVKQCYCYGTTEILYVNPAQFVGAFSTFGGWISPARSGVHPRTDIAWQLHSFRKSRLGITLWLEDDYRRYGELRVFS